MVLHETLLSFCAPYNGVYIFSLCEKRSENLENHQKYINYS